MMFIEIPVFNGARFILKAIESVLVRGMQSIWFVINDAL